MTIDQMITALNAIKDKVGGGERIPIVLVGWGNTDYVEASHPIVGDFCDQNGATFKCALDERWYYIRLCAQERWSIESLHNHLRADDYHHVGTLPNNFAQTLSPMSLATAAVRSFKDEYLLDLINLDNVDARYGYETDERVLSKSMVANIEKTIASLGGDDFCFMGREKRLVFSDKEFFVDLLFFHRGLKAMVAIELKLGDFHPGYLGQLNLKRTVK